METVVNLYPTVRIFIEKSSKKSSEGIFNSDKIKLLEAITPW